MSATMPVEVLDVTKKFMRDPIRILVKKEELTLEGIRQFYIQVEREVNSYFIIDAMTEVIYTNQCSLYKCFKNCLTNCDDCVAL